MDFFVISVLSDLRFWYRRFADCVRVYKSQVCLEGIENYEEENGCNDFIDGPSDSVFL